MRFLLTGASGQLGAYLIDRLIALGHQPIAWSGSAAGSRSGVEFEPIDLTDPGLMADPLERSQPDVILHAAALSAAESVRLDPDRARKINVEATQQLARWASNHNRRLIFTSTDLVFDGSRPWNRETDPASPILAYGRTKLEAEASVLECSTGLVARLALLYGPSRCGRPYFYNRAIEAIRAGQPQPFFEDEFRTPLDLATAALILVRLALSTETGLFHVGGAERVSRYELMRRATIALELDPSMVRSNRRSDVDLPEPRPADVSMDTTRLISAFPDLVRPTIEQAVQAG